MPRVGGQRGGGRRRNDPPTKARCVYLTDDQVKLLRMWGRGDVSAGIRWLIQAAAPMVVKLEKKVETEVDDQQVNK